MGDTNYFSGVVKILENPVQNVVNEKLLLTTFRVEIPQIRQNKIISLVFWGNLAHDITNYYRINDYILVEGYSSIENQSSRVLSKNLKKIIITVLKAYPFFLDSDRNLIKD